MNFKVLLAENARKHANKAALLYGDQKFSFQEIDERSNQTAHVLLSLGVSRDSRVALLLPPTPDMVIAYFGVIKTAAIAVPIDHRVSLPDLDFMLQDFHPEVLITNQAVLEPLRPRLASFESIKPRLVGMDETAQGPYLSYKKLALSYPTSSPQVEVKDDDLDMIQYTSGTTGHSKGVMITQAGRLSFRGIAQVWGQTEEDTFLLPEMPPAWMICMLLGPWTHGSTVVLITQSGHLPFLEAAARWRASLAFAPMPIVFQMARMSESEAKKFDLSSLRLILSGGLAPPRDIFDSMRDKFGVPLVLCYALNESGTWVALQPVDGSGRPDSVGKALPGVRIRILDESGQVLSPGQVGEIVIQGPGMMKGYYNRPLATAEVLRDGWIFTGDLGKLDEDGNLFVVGRKKEVIKMGDREIMPTDIEEVLHTHPAVLEVAVVGGDVGLKAVVVLKPGTTATAQDIIQFSRERLAPHEVPQKVEFATSLPRTLTGKIRRWALNK